MQTIALIPAYCPVDRMIPLIKELKELGFFVLIFDDGSGEEYGAIFNEARKYAEVLRYMPNRGKGEALKHGLRYIREQFEPPYTIVTADADGQHRTQDIVKVSETAAEHPDALVLGKRILGRSAPIKSKIGNGLTRINYRMTTGRRIHETQTGLRGFSDRLLPRFLTLPGHRYEYEIDMMLSAADIEIIETDIKTIYFDNNSASHFRPIHDTVSLNKEFIRYKLPSVIAGAAGCLLFAAAAYITKMWLLPAVGSRIVSLLLKYILSKRFAFCEKASTKNSLITSAVILVLDIAAMWGLITIGINKYIAKLISAVLMTAVGVIMRMIAVRRKYH